MFEGIGVPLGIIAAACILWLCWLPIRLILAAINRLERKD